MRSLSVHSGSLSQAVAGDPQNPGPGDSAGANSTGQAKCITDSANRQRKLYLDGEEHSVRCISRSELSQGSKSINGPLIIEESYTVLLLLPGWSVRVIDNADLLCERILT